jgi:hypothetical protein
MSPSGLIIYPICPKGASAGTWNLRAILSTTLALIDHYGDTERHGAILIELKRSLEHAIGELDLATQTRRRPPVSWRGQLLRNCRSV